MKLLLELISGMFLCGLGCGFGAFVLICLYDHWGPNEHKLSERDQKRKGDAFVMVICLAVAIGAVGFFARFYSDHWYGTGP